MTKLAKLVAAAKANNPGADPLNSLKAEVSEPNASASTNQSHMAKDPPPTSFPPRKSSTRGASSVPSSPHTKLQGLPRAATLTSNKSPDDAAEQPDADPADAENFSRPTSTFKGAWSYRDPDATKSRRGSEDGIWRRWVEIPLGLGAPEVDAEERVFADVQGGPRVDSPEPENEQENAAGPSQGAPLSSETPKGTPTGSRQASTNLWPLPDPLKLFGLKRTQSLPHMDETSQRNSVHEDQDTGPHNDEGVHEGKGWAVLKKRLRAQSHTGHRPKRRATLQEAAVTAAEVDLNEELMAGPLSVLVLRMFMEHDEDGRKRVPVLLQHLKIRVSDSVHPLHRSHAVFRIECEYGDGAARWVIYRELRDFLSLHTHYNLSNVSYNSFKSGKIDVPDFPVTSIPLFNMLKLEGNSAPKKAEFAKQQREALENYLIGLIKAVMFRPEANRLCRWFEISALSVSLAARGGVQGKAGLLRVMSSNAARLGSHQINLSGFLKKHIAKWWLVRESYLVSVIDPADMEIDDVFILDADFSIERPKRVYRQGLSLLHIGDSTVNSHAKVAEDWDVSKVEAKKVEEREDEKGVRSKDHADADTNATHTEKSMSTIGRFFSRSKDSKSPEAKRDKEEDKDDVVAQPFAANQGGRETNEDIRSDAHVEKRQVGIEGTEKNADVKPMDANNNNQRRTANAEGTAVDAVPDPHVHGERLRKRFASGDTSSGDEDDENARHKNIDPSIGRDPRKIGSQDDKQSADGTTKKKASTDVSQHTFYIRNAQRKLKFIAKNERQMLQFIASMERMAAQSHWTGTNRFGSFAPIRLNVSAQWLCDGRDYFWNLSRAIMLAKERIYIHDWWLSPELYMRRPGQEAYRLDRLLKRKAEQGVKVYVILYKEVSNRTTPVDSNYAKRRLMGLHSNILVQRSPSHFTTGTFYWAHHEKMCVIDEAIAFMGGFDMCFGRWDTPQHILIDDGGEAKPEGSDHIWPGKDYSNARVADFHSLNKPDEDMYDRTKVPRMPWHDIGVQIVGQPARDLCRHFVQRWNYLLRTKTHSRLMPFLVPAPDFKITEMNEQGLTGTCEIQICRSAGPWSLGTATRIEHSIQNAYLKAIELSEHFVYIENQFFVTSTVVNEIPVENNIGDALVHRIIRAHREGTPWRACVLIPLLPGFTFPIDHNDASSIRLIVELQNRSICRGPHSIFSRLRKEGINPDDYITFFSLRGWGKLDGGSLTTEQVYIHAKIMIVDDRVAIIGSANINERSMRGDRDSELACVIRDTDMIESTMGGKPFKVGRFAHTMRIRLMREHVGVDTDAMYEEDLLANHAKQKPQDVKAWDPDHEQVTGRTEGITTIKHRSTLDRYEVAARETIEQGLLGAGEITAKLVGKTSKRANAPGGLKLGPGAKSQAEEKRTLASDGSSQPGFASSKVPTLEEQVVYEHRPHKTEDGSEKPLMDSIDEGNDGEPVPEAAVADGSELYGAPADAAPSAAVDDRPPNSRPGQDEASEAEKAAVVARRQIRKHLAVQTGAKPHTLPTPKPEIDPHGFDDPLDPDFFKDVWIATAVHNTQIYRKVFHCTPDDLVTTWKQYKEFLQFQERLNKPSKDASPNAPTVARVPSEGGTAGEQGGGAPNTHPDGHMDPKQSVLSDDSKDQGPQAAAPDGNLAPPNGDTSSGDRDARPRRTTNHDEPLEQWEREEFETLLDGINGHLVVFPTRFLEGEDTANNFLFNSDRLLPMPIFN